MIGTLLVSFQIFGRYEKSLYLCGKHHLRQTGKTSCMLALRDFLNKSGDYIAAYVNVEGGQASRNDVDSVVKSTCDSMAERFRTILKSDKPLQLRDEVRNVGKDSMLAIYLCRMSESLSKPLFLIIDEIDAWECNRTVCLLIFLKMNNKM